MVLRLSRQGKRMFGKFNACECRSREELDDRA